MLLCEIAAPAEGKAADLSILRDNMSFQDFRVGMAVQVKNAAALQEIFSSRSSQWSRELGPNVQNNVNPRLNLAGHSGVVVVVDSADNTVRIDCNGTKVWFTPGRRMPTLPNVNWMIAILVV